MKDFEKLTQKEKADFWWHTRRNAEEIRVLAARVRYWERAWLDKKEIKYGKGLDWLKIRSTLTRYSVASELAIRDLDQITDYLDKVYTEAQSKETNDEKDT